MLEVVEELLQGRINHFPTHFAPAVPNPHSVQNADFPLEGTEARSTVALIAQKSQVAGASNRSPRATCSAATPT
eukprot:COSAG06_NODE_21470_length_755_cov_2.579268_1_plen_73_part_10